MFVDLTAAYDTVWHNGITCMLLLLPSDIYRIYMIVEMVDDRSLTLPPEMANGAGCDISRSSILSQWTYPPH